MAKKVFGNKGGSYHKWFPTDQPMLRIANAGASRLILQKNGFALPRYSDSSKAAYILQGSGSAGIVFPEQKEKVISVKKGDAIILPYGVISWWYNEASTPLMVLFLGETSKAHSPGEFTDFLLSGKNGIFSGLSIEFASRAWGLEENMAETILENQSGSNIVKLNQGTVMPKPRKLDRQGIVINCLESKPDVDVKNGGRVVNFNTKNLPLAKEVGFGGDLVSLDKNAMCSPGYSSDSAYQVTHIVRGRGRAQVVGMDGKRVLEIEVKAGYLLVIPRFYVVSKIAGDEGLQWFSIVTSPSPVFNQLGGSNSVWKALSPQVIEASFNVSSDVEKLLRLKRNDVQIFFPPPI
ncbi:hypothetical protein ACHQM5_021197 [Ranunculus cassubicifolius]